LAHDFGDHHAIGLRRDTMFTRLALFAVLLMTLSMPVVAAEGMLGIARIGDPPPAIDGSLASIGASPTTLMWNRPEQMVFGPDQWRDTDDLSGQLFLGWDRNFLYVAAIVTDDMVTQPYFGNELFRGDHLEVFIDVPRGGKSVWQIGLSPGNFTQGPNYTPPEIVRWLPTVGTVAGAKIAARRTGDGYQIEAAIPWSALGVEQVDLGLPLGIDVTLSDADEMFESQQATMASLLTSVWEHGDPARMLETALVGADGKVDPALIKRAFVPVVEALRVEVGQTAAVELGEADEQPVAELIVRARIDYKQLAGGTHTLAITVNGEPLGFERVRNRLRRIEMGTMQQSSCTGTHWFICYAPDFTPAPPQSSYAVRGVDPYELRFDVSDLWKPRDNDVRITHVQLDVPGPIIADVAVSEQLSAKLEPPKPKVAPTGPIPTFVPGTAARPAFDHALTDEGAIRVTFGSHQWDVVSAFSTTEPGWARLTDAGQAVRTADYEVRRTVNRHDDHIQVIDRITNTSDDDQPVMVTHMVDAGPDLKSVYIAGRKVETSRYQVEEGEHPASVALCDDAGIALLSEDDLMRAQSQNVRRDTSVGIANNRLVVAQGTTVELEFSIYPLEKPDLYTFINRVRRNWGVNFAIDGSFGFMYHKDLKDITDEQLAANLGGKAAKFICANIGIYAAGEAQGRAFKFTDPTDENLLFARAKRLRPDTKTFFYYHAFISSHEDDPTLYAADRLLRPDGSHANYRQNMYPIFVPREGSAFAAMQDEMIDLRYELLDLDGMFWDEIAYSAYKYDFSDQWDGYTAIIDPQTHRITRKIANVTLATLSWRTTTAEQFLARGLLIGNGAPQTRTFTRLHFPRFIETASITNLVRGQLYTPIALGDHLTERTPRDCYHNMVDGLNFGAVYYWYWDKVVATEPTLTSYMFPITYIRMGEGFIIGEQRIITNRSGRFGWGDDSEFEAVVFDHNGQRTDAVNVPRIVENGKVFAEVRIPEGYAVALIRRQP
jgi:hypothetical protein